MATVSLAALMRTSCTAQRSAAWSVQLTQRLPAWCQQQPCLMRRGMVCTSLKQSMQLCHCNWVPASNVQLTIFIQSIQSIPSMESIPFRVKYPPPFHTFNSIDSWALHVWRLAAGCSKGGCCSRRICCCCCCRRGCQLAAGNPVRAPVGLAAAAGIRAVQPHIHCTCAAWVQQEARRGPHCRFRLPISRIIGATS